MSSDSTSQREPLEELAEEFVQRFRLGQAPSIRHYAEQHPELADRIRRLFPKLVLMEQMSPSDDGRSTAESSDAALNKQLGDFRLLREVARGGMGVVYEAEQQSLGRRVALKVLMRNPLVQERQRRRFRREAQAAARLHHTNIVPVYGVGQHEDTCFYVMQLIHGRGLNEVLRELYRLRESGSSLAEETPLRESSVTDPSVTDVAQGLLAGQLSSEAVANTMSSDGSDSRSRVAPLQISAPTSGAANQHYWRSVARIGAQVADALQYAHAQGTFHRDIKPANLLLDSRGTVWVADFGLAKVAEDDDLTREGDVVGTLRYMAPEQFESRCDARSDIYSLGLTLYELLTLQPAFDEPHAATRRKTGLEPSRPRLVNPEIPRDLETIILKASASEPNARYQTAEQLAEDLRRFLTDRPIEARRVSPLEHAWRWCRRNPLIAGLTTAVALMILVIAVGSAALAFRALENTQLAEENSVRALDLAVAGARSRRTDNRPGHRLESLKAIARAAQLLPEVALPPERRKTMLRELRDDSISALTMIDAELQEDWSYGASPLGLIRCGFDSQIEQYARQEDSGHVVVRQLSDNTELHRLGVFDVVDEIRVYTTFSPNDRLLAAKGLVDGSLKVRVWDLADGKLVLDTNVGGRHYHTNLEFSPNSRELAVCSLENSVNVLDVRSGATLHRIPTKRTPYFVRFDPTGKRLALGNSAGSGERGEVIIVDLKAPQRKLSLPHPDFTPDAAWSGDGRWLATPCYDYHVRVWNAASGKVHTICDGHRGKPRHVAFHPHRDLLMSTSWDSTTRLWNLHTGQELLRSTDRGVRFSKDGKWLGSERPASVGVRRWRIATADACRTLHGHDPDAYVTFLAFSPEGSVLISASAKDGVRLWDVQRGRELTHLVTEYAAGVGFVNELPWRLLTSSRSGLRSWPVKLESTKASRIMTWGPPKMLPAKNPRHLSVGGETILVGSINSQATLHRGNTFAEIGPLDGPKNGNTKFVAVSPDGKWAATSGKRAAGVTIWDLETQTSVKHMPLGPARVEFSPDGQQLVVSVFKKYVLCEVGSWRRLRQFSHDGPGYGCLAFSPDMGSMALTASHRVILRDASSGAELATLAAPNPELLSTAHPEGAAGLCFSPDGRLLAVGAQGGKIRLWSVDSIRRSLGEIGLDWSSNPPLAAKPVDSRPLILDVRQD